jgi:hypothetical protein
MPSGNGLNLLSLAWEPDGTWIDGGEIATRKNRHEVLCIGCRRGLLARRREDVAHAQARAAVVAVAVGLAAAPSAADPPTHLFLEDDVTFQSGGLTAACGFPVLVSLEGGIHIMLRTDKNGVPRELDTFSDWSITYTAPSQGTSFSFKFGPATFAYPEGTAVGAPAIITLRASTLATRAFRPKPEGS